MHRNIAVERSREIPIERQAIEIVERKGLGHPDYMADSIAEEFSRALSNEYLKVFGKVLHHNVDKLEIIGGKTEPAFGGGKIVTPMTILFSGRATTNFNGKDIDVKNLAISSAKGWIKNNMRFIDPETIRFIFETKSGALSLSDAFIRDSRPTSNDTSFGAGYAPLSHTESTVLEIEKYMNGKDFKNKFPFSGEDIKVMGIRNQDEIKIIVAAAIVDKFVTSAQDYFDKKEKIKEDVLKFAKDKLNGKKRVSLDINCMDDVSRGIDGCYLTVMGTSAEHGDDGAVGRGNRVNGIITPNRTMSMEAAAGKNPINHVGKIYNLLAFKIAESVYKEFNTENSVYIVGNIGKPIDEPAILTIAHHGDVEEKTNKGMLKIADDELSSIDKITQDLIDGKLKVF